MTGERGTGENPTVLEGLIEDSLEEFRRQRFFQGERILEPYTLNGAVKATLGRLEGYSSDPLWLYGQVRAESRVLPVKVKEDLTNVVRSVDEDSDWDDILRDVVVQIVRAELVVRHPDTKLEDEARYSEFLELNV